MKIFRDGKEIELTKEELFNAYKEQEGIFDIQNIKDNMEYYLDESHETLIGNKDFIEEAASELRRNLDKYDMDYENAISSALKNTKIKYI